MGHSVNHSWFLALTLARLDSVYAGRVLMDSFEKGNCETKLLTRQNARAANCSLTFELAYLIGLFVLGVLRPHLAGHAKQQLLNQRFVNQFMVAVGIHLPRQA